MASSASWKEEVAGGEDAPLKLRRRVRGEAELDMTPMIDCTFLLLVFFLVASTPDLQTEVELPPARYGTPVNPNNAAIVTVAKGEGAKSALIYLADGKVGTPLPDDPKTQEAMIVDYLAGEHRQGKNLVLLKGEKGVRHRDIARVAGAVSQVQGMTLELAVFEID